MVTMSRGSAVAAAVVLGWLGVASALAWPMPWAAGPDGAGGSNFAEEVFGVRGRHSFRENGTVRVQLFDCDVPANILWPGDRPTFVFQVENLTDRDLDIRGKADVIQYALRTPGDDFFMVDFVKLAECGATPFTTRIPARGFVNLTFDKLPIPERFGGYGLVVDLGAHGRLMGALTVRVVKPAQAENPKPFPRVMMDGHYPDVLTRLGVVSNRVGVPMRPTTSPGFEAWYAELSRKLRGLHEAHVTTTIEFGGGPPEAQPLGAIRGPAFTNERGEPYPVMDNAWLPQFDADFQALVRRLVSEHGWPHGPVVGAKLYNEPWEGGGIDGWGADMVRYREMYTALARGVEEARAQAGVEVLLGGCDSTSNTFDKLFATGDEPFLKWLDFTSLHYQGMNTPVGYKPWRRRVDAAGNPAPVRIWDTESWIANSDERIAAVLSAYCASGYERVVGTFGDGFIQGLETITLRTPEGTKEKFIKRPWSVGAAVAAFSAMIGDRPFRELLFRNGLPWVMVFDGLPDAQGNRNTEDGTVVVVGDLDPVFNRDTLPFRGVAIRNARMVIATDGDRYQLFDSYANPVPPTAEGITLPLDGSGYYLRGNGRPGSFAALLDALRHARIDGIAPVEIKAHDLTTRVERGATLRLTLTNVLNRPVTGTLTASLGTLTLDAPEQTLTLAAHETRDVALNVGPGAAAADNSYALRATFDAGGDGRVEHAETMRVNVVSRRSPRIDGKLDDWADALPQPVASDGVARPSTEQLAWRPWEKIETRSAKGFAIGYLAYDDEHFYFAAKIADATPHPGMHRMEGSNDDEWFYPEVVYRDGQPVRWPLGVRRYTYAKQPELPAGNFPPRDNVQIGFGVLDDAERAYEPFPPGTREDFGFVPTNDYEYALNPIAERYGGGTEIWRLCVPGMPEKNFSSTPASPPAPSTVR